MNWEGKNLSLFNSIYFCLEGFRHGGMNEVKQRYALCSDLLLNKWIGPWYEKPVVKYYNRIGITPVYPGGLKASLSTPGQSPNRRMLFYYAYAVKHLLTVPGIPELLARLANIGRTPDEGTTHEGERCYHNNMVELHGCYFVHRCLHMEIMDVEYDQHFIRSPNRLGNRSCDIKGKINGNDYYFDCKDSSTEIVHQEPFYDIHVTSPRNSHQNRMWLEGQMQEADNKGSDYLLAKIPLWSQYKGRKRNREWMSKVFSNAIYCGGGKYRLLGNATNYRVLKSVFILNQRSALELILR
jgi:hypothetical protein